MGEATSGGGEGSTAGWSRRGVVAALAGGALVVPLSAWWLTQGPPIEVAPGAVGPPEQVSLEAFLDTILPSGEFPGHRETGVLGVLWSVAERNQALRAKFREGAQLLDLAAKGSFVASSPDARTRTLASLAAAVRSDPGRLYYVFLRDQAMRLHYTHPVARARLGFNQPPQPSGYPGYTEAPGA
ncbi:MAG: hypothetical protein JKY65_23245 [Planctomycetes bacterium]|nr:hypothetical protein [Planctomycetota bacterium]